MHQTTNNQHSVSITAMLIICIIAIFKLTYASGTLGAPRTFTADLVQNDEEQRELKIYSDKMNCVSKIRPFNTRFHKEKYRIGVQAIRGLEQAYAEFNLTFSEYLTATAGQRFDPPIEFEMVPMIDTDLYNAIYEEEVDFFFAEPSIYSCIGIEIGAQPLATVTMRLEVRGLVFDLDFYGGVIFTMAERNDINTITDLKDKVIGAATVSSLTGSQVQMYEMGRAGMSYVMDPKQIVFTGNMFNVVEGVLAGDFDVGFVRTDQIERTINAKGNVIDPDMFKIIQPKIFILDDGNLFPFLHSTDIYPENPLAALNHVDGDVSKEVELALLALQDHAEAGRLIEECLAINPYSNTCNTTIPFTRCDTTNDLATLAWEASKDGLLAGFRTPRSYFDVRTMQEAAGFLKKDETSGNWFCARDDNFYIGIDCPADHYKISQEDFLRSCDLAGQPCKDGYNCFCRPCIKAFEVEIYAYTNDKLAVNTGCEKMGLCGTVEQTKNIKFEMVDNLQRKNPRVHVVARQGASLLEIEARPTPDKPYTYDFSWWNNEVGVGILEIFFDDDQIPQSPIRVQVVDRNCKLDYPGADKVSSDSGECVCGGSFIDFYGKCVSSTIIAVSASLFAFLVVAIGVYFFIQHRNRQNDKMWLVNVEELHFDDPVEVIGQGSFGVVLLAEFRGTKVAIKRAIKDKKKKASKHGSTYGRTSQVTSSINGKTKTLSSGSEGHSGSVDAVSIASSEDMTRDTRTEIESQTSFGDTYGDSQTLGSFPATQSRNTSNDISLGFLAEDFGKKSKWAWLFPWLQQDKKHSHFKESILGDSASKSGKSMSAKLFPWCNADKRREEEFMHEMRILSRLRHPCITTVMGAVVSSTHDPMLVMEYMEYGSLHELLSNDTMYLSGEIILQILRDVAQGMRYLHSSRPPILHGDLKGRNILIDSRFRAKICDFGLANKTQSLITGTPYWMAPEYLRGQSEYDTTCDIYSIGIIFYEIYSRKSPYEGENFRDVLRAICNRRVNKRPPIPEGIPPKMADLMKKCWSPDPSYRPSAKDLDITLMDMNSQDAEHVKLEDEQEARKTGDMLYELFPRKVADQLKAGQKVDAEQHDEVTVVFSDIVHFTDISRELTPLQVSKMLDRLYLAFDRIAREHKVFKVETIGDAYMGVTNLENDQNDTHTKNIAEFAVDMITEASKIIINEENPSMGYINIRVGFHSGPVVSNVIGSLNPRYGLFGDTVNTASRMESNSQANRVLCSEKAYNLLKEQAPDFPTKMRGKISVKGKGDMNVFWIGDRLVRAAKKKKVKEMEVNVKHVAFEEEKTPEEEEEEKTPGEEEGENTQQ